MLLPSLNFFPRTSRSSTSLSTVFLHTGKLAANSHRGRRQTTAAAAWAGWLAAGRPGCGQAAAAAWPPRSSAMVGAARPSAVRAPPDLGRPGAARAGMARAGRRAAVGRGGGGTALGDERSVRRRCVQRPNDKMYAIQMGNKKKRSFYPAKYLKRK
jgi:hypothetical protein